MKRMTSIFSFLPSFKKTSSSSNSPSKETLTAIEKVAYACEAEDNFRALSSLLATKSRYILTPADLVDDATHTCISDIGQYAELAHGFISPEFVFRNMDALCQPEYPLGGYEALKNDGARFITQFSGDVAAVQGYAAFRPKTRQLVLAFSGTSSVTQAVRDMQTWKVAYPLDAKRSSVHAGFWAMYCGMRRPALEALRAGFKEYGEELKEVVLTGHSMGCTLCYLLALDLMVGDLDIISSEVALSVVVFGSPRIGNEGLAKLWRASIEQFNSRPGSGIFREYSVKGYRDGVHTLPPYSLGFRHLTASPLYLYLGRLYRVPASESEHGSFTVEDFASSPQDDSEHTNTVSSSAVLAPSAPGMRCVAWTRGGHNYYIRDMARFQRRMRWLDLNRHSEQGWQERYLTKLKTWERKWGKEHHGSEHDTTV